MTNATDTKVTKEGAALVGLLGGLEIWICDSLERGVRLTPEVHAEARRRLALLQEHIDEMLES